MGNFDVFGLMMLGFEDRVDRASYSEVIIIFIYLGFLFYYFELIVGVLIALVDVFVMVL